MLIYYVLFIFFFIVQLDEYLLLLPSCFKDFKQMLWCPVNIFQFYYFMNNFYFPEKEKGFTDEAMAGLSSTEDLAAASTALRKTAKDSSGVSTEIKDFGGFLPVMLLQIKGLHQSTSTIHTISDVQCVQRVQWQL